MPQAVQLNNLCLLNKGHAKDKWYVQIYEALFIILLLIQIVKNGSGYGPEIWGLYAKWHRIKGDLMMCSEALLKQVRSLQVCPLRSSTYQISFLSKRYDIISVQLRCIPIATHLQNKHYMQCLLEKVYCSITCFWLV